jgi:crotonobetainyl-CoA:carnitine CoA-transferase CaiB-like acyl-CoA transferase
MVIEMAGGYRGTGIPIKLDRTPGAARRPPPAFGEHGEEILAEAGFSNDEIAALAADGILLTERRRIS